MFLWIYFSLKLTLLDMFDNVVLIKVSLPPIERIDFDGHSLDQLGIGGVTRDYHGIENLLKTCRGGRLDHLGGEFSLAQGEVLANSPPDKGSSSCRTIHSDFERGFICAEPITKPTVPHPVSSLITQPAHQYCNHAVASSPVIINRIFSVMKFDDLKELGSEGAVKAAGKYRQEGKTYVVQDADIIFSSSMFLVEGRNEPAMYLHQPEMSY
ncbi:Obg-like ATPase 1 [Vitis vinifera]|uniref:Obg-like ATPase 1 n=1 Tax=Vitis vinifera TaxID=29760 RepID=A0A438GS80_VITVI|nr:Obg-like ATPase 1 [Vitis vinifera]